MQLIADTMGYFNGPVTGGLPGPHQLQSMTSTAATGQSTTSTFTWDAAGRMTGRAGETLSYTPDGKLATTTGTSTLPTNPNPSANAGTPPAPVSGTAGSSGTRYYDAGGNLVGITDGTGTTVTLGSITAHSTPAGVKTATKTYSFAGRTVAQRTAAGGAVKLALIVSDSVGTTQTIVQGAVGTTPVITQTRYTDPTGLARGPTQTATGNGAYTTAGAGVTGVGTNAANQAGYGAVNGYIGGLADTVSTLTHLGARDLDPVTGTFTAPDPVLKRDEARNFSPYLYANAVPVNASDPSGLAPTPDGGEYYNDYFDQPRPNTHNQDYPIVLPTSQLGTNIGGQIWGVQEALGQAVDGLGQPTAAIGKWALGLSQSKGPESYQNGGEYIDAIRQRPETAVGRDRILGRLREGNTSGVVQAGYSAGSPGLDNPNFVLDMCTLAMWVSECGGARPRAITALGTYDLVITVDSSDVAHQSAILSYTARNDITLGSALGPTKQIRDFLNTLPLTNGPFSRQEQVFTWKESVKW